MNIGAIVGIIICMFYVIAFVCACIEIKGEEERERRRVEKNRELFKKMRIVDVNKDMLE